MSESFETPHPWQRIERSKINLSDSLVCYKDRIRISSDAEADYLYLDRAASATVVAQTNHRDLVMIRQYRYAVDAWCWELPAGALIPGVDKTFEDTASRELKEETGAICRELHDIGWFYIASHLSNEITHVVVGTDATLGESMPEVTEVIQVRLVPVRDAFSMARRGEILDGPSALALLLAEKWL